MHYATANRPVASGISQSVGPVLEKPEPLTCPSTTIRALERSGGRYGLQTMCECGGTANVTIIERL